jgi:hypothetical protein
VDAEDRLPVSASDILLALQTARHFTPANNNQKAFLSACKTTALDLVDWAVEESDRGQELRRLKAERLYRPGGGNITIPDK